MPSTPRCSAGSAPAGTLRSAAGLWTESSLPAGRSDDQVAGCEARRLRDLDPRDAGAAHHDPGPRRARIARTALQPGALARADGERQRAAQHLALAARRGAAIHGFQNVRARAGRPARPRSIPASSESWCVSKTRQTLLYSVEGVLKINNELDVISIPDPRREHDACLHS